jgi:hypothetical protein
MELSAVYDLSGNLTKHLALIVISGFRHKADEICTLVGYYAAYSSNSLPTFRDNLLFPFSMMKEHFTLEDGMDSL